MHLSWLTAIFSFYQTNQTMTGILNRAYYSHYSRQTTRRQTTHINSVWPVLHWVPVEQCCLGWLRCEAWHESYLKGVRVCKKKEMVIFWPHWIVKIKVRKKWRGGNLQTQNTVFIVKVSVFWLCKCSFVILWLFYDFQTLSLCRGLADLVKRFSIIPVPVSGCCYIT